MSPRKITVLIAAAGLVLAACGSAEDDETASVEGYCELSAELNAQGDPTQDQLDEIIALAPDEIRDEVEALVDALARGDEELSEEVFDAVEAIDDFEAENCDAVDDDDPGAGEAPAIVTIGSPATGDTVTNPVVVEPSVTGATIAPAGESGEGQGHYHVMIDTDCLATGEVIPADASHVHFGDGSTTLELGDLAPGEHTLCVQLGDGSHQAFGAASTVTVEVTG